MPVTNIAGAAVAVYETSKKRDRWREYANGGDVYSQYELAESLCCKLRDGPRNQAESFKWFCFAGKNGHARAQLKLGQLFEGDLVFDELNLKPDLAKSYAWYYFAAKRSNAEAAAKRDALAQKMTRSQLAQAYRLLETSPRYMPCVVEETP